MKHASGNEALQGQAVRTPHSGNQASCHPLNPGDRSRDWDSTIPRPQDAGTAPWHRDLSTPRSRHPARGGSGDGYCSSYSSRSRHSGGSRHTGRSRSRSRHSEGSRHTGRSRSSEGSRRTSRSRSQYGDVLRHTGSSRPDGSRHSDLTSPPYDRPRHDAVTDGKWTFPLPWDVYQRKVLNLLVDLRNQFKQTQPASSAIHIERMETMEDFEREEQRLCDKQAFDDLVL